MIEEKRECVVQYNDKLHLLVDVAVANDASFGVSLCSYGTDRHSVLLKA